MLWATRPQPKAHSRVHGSITLLPASLRATIFLPRLAALLRLKRLRSEWLLCSSRLAWNGIVYTFDGKGNYTSKIKKRVTEGTYKFDSKAKTITFTPTIGMAYTAHVAVQGSTMTLTFEADKLMTTLKTISNATSKLSTTAALINTLMNSYSGMRVGFELKK